MNIQVPGTDQTRSFSFSSGPGADEVGFLIRNTTDGVLTTYLRDRAKVGDRIEFNGPLGSFYLREINRPVLFLAGGTGLAPFLSMLHKIEQDGGSEHPIHLIFGVTNDPDLVAIDELEGYAERLPNFTFTCMVAAEDSSYPNKGLRHPPHEARAPQRRAGGHLPLRAAADGRRGAQATWPTRASTGELLLREVLRLRSGQRDRRVHVKAVDSDEAFDARMALELGAAQLVVGKLSAEQLAEYRQLAEATGASTSRTATSPTPAGFRETNSAFHLFPIEATGNATLVEAYRKLLVQEYMGHVLTPSVDLVGDITKDHVDIVDAYERHDFEALRAHHRRAQRPRQGDDAGRDREAGRLSRMIFPGRFEGKVLVVTGAAQGLGEAVATRAAREGGAVALVDRSRLVQEVADKLAGEGAQTIALVANLEQYLGAATAIAAARNRFGRIDILINNVGGAINFKPYVEFTEAEIQAEIRRSLLPTMWCCRAVLPAMVEQGRGVIVNVSSAAARGIHRIPYSAAKGGVNALTASLAWEYADHGIRVVATAPGGIEAPPRKISRGTPQAQTEQEKAWFQAHIDQTLTSSLMHRYGTLDEEVAPILFLASDEASYITGTRLPVAGGDLG